MSPVGDGNPSAALALELQARHQGIPAETLLLSATARAAQIFHERMTADPQRARAYIDESATRTGLLSSAYARASAFEFAQRFRHGAGDEEEEEANWTVVQEHPLLGISPNALRRLGITSVRLATPDVYPKDSGIMAARKHAGMTSVYVWNDEAHRALAAEGVHTTLTRPYMLDGFHPNGGIHDTPGLPVVAKTSGSGFPPAWRSAVLGALGATDTDWAFHTPMGRFAADGTNGMSAGDNGRITSFYGDLGNTTRLVIGYPSELVGAVADMNEQGQPTWMLAFPPRGAHEKANLEFAHRHGILLGELALNPSATIDGIKHIPLSELPAMVTDLEEPKWDHGVVGTQKFWEAALS